LPAHKNAAVLELGCGHGTFLYWLRKEGYLNLTGIDASREQVDLARRVWPAVQQGDLRPFLETVNERYDFIAALDVLEHFSRQEGLNLVRAVQRALRPGGAFLLQTLNADSPFMGQQRYGDLTHEVAYNRRSLATLLRLAGFQRMEFVALGPVAHGPVSALRWLLWRGIVLGLKGYQLIEMGTADGAIFTQGFAACAYK
ncbi:MAG: class I SAM-dependent methyltransferase, partial [Terriglobia bacterium]